MGGDPLAAGADGVRGFLDAASAHRRRGAKAAAAAAYAEQWTSLLLYGGTCMDHLPLLESRGVQGLFGWKCVVDPTSMGRFLRRAGHAGAKVVEEALRKAVRPRWEATGGVPRVVQLTLDSAVSVRYGVKQAGAEVGYNPTKKGRPSHHPLLAFLDTGDCLGVRWRPGDANPATGAEEWIEGLVKWLRRIRTPGKLVRHARRLQLKLAHGDPVTQWLRDGLARLRTLQAQPITAM